MRVLGVSAGLLLYVPALPVGGGRVVSPPFFVLPVTVRAVVVPAGREARVGAVAVERCSRSRAAEGEARMWPLGLRVGCFSPSRVVVTVCGPPTRRTVHHCRCRVCACVRVASRRAFCVLVRGCVQRERQSSARIPCRGCRCPCGRAHTRLRRLLVAPPYPLKPRAACRHCRCWSRSL